MAGAARSQNVRTVIEAYGARTLVQDVGTTLSVAACTPFAIKLCQNAPNVVIVQIGRNDFFSATYTLANWTTQLGNWSTRSTP